MRILIINDSKAEALKWSRALTALGHDVVVEYSSLYVLIYWISHETVDFALCSSRLLNEGNIKALNITMKYFPKTQVVVVGQIPNAHYLTKLQNVSFRKDFDVKIEGLINEQQEELNAKNAKPDVPKSTATLLGDNFLSTEQADDLFKRAHPLLKSGLCVMAIVADSEHEKLNKDLEGLVHKHDLGYFIAIEGTSYIILDNCKTTERCIKHGHRLLKHLLSGHNCFLNIGISRIRAGGSSLAVCRREAERAAESVHLFGRNSVIHIDYIDTGDISYAYPHHKEKRLINETIDGNKDGAIKMLDEIFEVINNRPELKQNLINKIALGILVNLNIAAVSKVNAFEKLQIDNLSAGKLLSAKTAGDVYSFLRQGIMDFATEMDEIVRLKRDALYISLCNMVLNQEPVSIADLTTRFNTSISFLNTAIMQNTGKSLVEFFGELDIDVK